MRGMLKLTRFTAHFLHGLRKEDPLQKCKMMPIKNKIELQRARWIEKLAKMTENRTTRKLMTSWISQPRPTGRPQNTIRSGYAKTIARFLNKDNCKYEGELASWVNTATSSEWGNLIETKLSLKKGAYGR